MIKIQSKSKNKVSEKLDRLLELHEKLAEELQLLRQEQSNLQHTISSIDKRTRLIRHDILTQVAEGLEEIKGAARNMDDSARLILMTGIMDNIDELVGNKPECTTSSRRKKQ